MLVRNLGKIKEEEEVFKKTFLQGIVWWSLIVWSSDRLIKTNWSINWSDTRCVCVCVCVHVCVCACVPCLAAGSYFIILTPFVKEQQYTSSNSNSSRSSSNYFKWENRPDRQQILVPWKLLVVFIVMTSSWNLLLTHLIVPVNARQRSLPPRILCLLESAKG